MPSLETKVGKEVRTAVSEGLDCRLIRACRKKAEESHNSSSGCYEFFSGSYTLNLLKANEILPHIESYKSGWSKLESLSVNPTFLSLEQFDYLRGVVNDFKAERKMLVDYAYPNAFVRLAYHMDKKVSDVFARIPLWAKFFLFA